jgi:hypothetical protein
VSPRNKTSCLTPFLVQSAFLLLSTVTCLTACTEVGASHVERDVRRPQKVEQLLSNLKLAFDRELVLAPAFYDDSNLLKFFNGTSMQWRAIGDSDVYEAAITPSPLLVGMKEITVRMWKHGAPVLDSEIHIAVDASSELSLGHVRKVFGGETRTVPPDAPTHPWAGGYFPPTPYGIAYVKKICSAGDNCRPLHMEAKFSADGDFSGLPLHGRDQKPLPDQARVVFISLKVRVE